MRVEARLQDPLFKTQCGSACHSRNSQGESSWSAPWAQAVRIASSPLQHAATLGDLLGDGDDVPTAAKPLDLGCCMEMNGVKDITVRPQIAPAFPRRDAIVH
jgi:hypothetical protein